MTPVYLCPIHGSCRSNSGARRYDTATSGCSLYATPPYNRRPRRTAAVPSHHPTATARCRGDRCSARHIISLSPLTGHSSCCLAASRRQADSADAILSPVTNLDVVAGPELATAAATNAALRPSSGCVELGGAGADKAADTDPGVFYTTNSQHPEAYGHVSDLLSTTSWGREHHDVATNDDRTPPFHADGDNSQQITLTEATSAAASDRGQSSLLLVDF